MGAAEQLELAADPLVQLSDTELLSEAFDAAAVLAMGPADALSAFALLPLRRQLVDAARELARRWQTDVSP